LIGGKKKETGAEKRWLKRERRESREEKEKAGVFRRKDAAGHHRKIGVK